VNNLETDKPSAPDIDHTGDVRRPISSIVATAIDPNDSPHLLVIFGGDLPGECHDSRDDQDLSDVNGRSGERAWPDV
jgi:hypothetical protein